MLSIFYMPGAGFGVVKIMMIPGFLEFAVQWPEKFEWNIPIAKCKWITAISNGDIYGMVRAYSRGMWVLAEELEESVAFGDKGSLAQEWRRICKISRSNWAKIEGQEEADEFQS